VRMHTWTRNNAAAPQGSIAATSAADAPDPHHAWRRRILSGVCPESLASLTLSLKLWLGSMIMMKLQFIHLCPSCMIVFHMWGSLASLLQSQLQYLFISRPVYRSERRQHGSPQKKAAWQQFTGRSSSGQQGKHEEGPKAS